MAYIFGDGFDCYAAMGDALLGYWDSGTATPTLQPGRFTGSQCVQLGNIATTVILSKSSGANDAVHHIVVAFRQTATLTGTNANTYFQLLDGVTAQCCIVFRSDGAILLTSGTPIGTTLATYSGAVTAANTWFAFEFEVVISNTVGRFRARKNGNTVDDYDSGATLNTRPGANSYANKLQVGGQVAIISQQIDDLFWRSDASSVSWVGDIRCYTRMPSSDASVQFTKAMTYTLSFVGGTTTPDATNTSRYTQFTTTFAGTVGTATINLTGFTGNMKMAIFSDNGGVPGTFLGSATTIVNPVGGANTFTFPTPVSVAASTAYWLGVSHDVTVTINVALTSTAIGRTSSAVSYAAFPASSPTVGGNAQNILGSVTVTPTYNFSAVSEAQQDGATSYVYDSTPGHADFYGIAPIASTPVATIAVTTRGFMEKSDAGTRTAAVQLKSGGSTVSSSTTALASSSWGWVWRTDLTDPSTSAAWTAVAVNNVNIGPTVVA